MDIHELIHTYGDDLYRIAYLYTKDRQVAEEVVQDVFVNFYQKNNFEGRAHIKTYLTRMTINRSYDYLRSFKGRTAQLFEQMKQTTHSSEHQTIVEEEKMQITNALLKLPIKYREVLTLYYYEDLQVKEIAELLNASESTVKSRLQRARKQLETLLPEQQWEVLKNGTQ